MQGLVAPLPLGQLAILTAAAVNGNTNDLQNNVGKGLKLYINVSAIGSLPTFTVTVQGKDPVSGQYFTILASAGLVAIGFVVLDIYPGLAVTTNLSADDFLPDLWRVSWTISGGTVTGTISGSICP